MTIDKSGWLWAGEYGRDRILRDAVEQQALATAAVRASARRDVAKLRSDLASMQGSVETRLTALTNAFVAFVELDGIRKQLEAFPDEARARRFALADLESLLAGEVPPERPDVEGYWLPPAVAALRPDGSIDEGRAAIARQRDPEATRVFLAVARTALGVGPQMASELPILLKADEAGTWSEVQLLLWAALLRGAFGSDALPRLAGVLGPVIESAEDWLDWAREQARTRTEAATLDWVGDQIEAVRPRGTKLEETGFTATSVTGDYAAPAFSPNWRPARSWSLSIPETVPEAEPEAPSNHEPEDSAPAEEVPVEHANASESTYLMLIELCHHYINEGRPQERGLLARAALLEEQFTNPQGAKTVPTEIPEQRHDVLGLVRDVLVGEHAARQDRRWLWQLVGRRVAGVVQGWRNEPEPRPETVKVGAFDLTADLNGVLDGAKERAIRREYDAAMQSQGMFADGKTVMLIAAGVVVASIALMCLGMYSMWLGIVIGVGLAAWGHQCYTSLKERRAQAEAIRKSLDNAIQRAINTSAENHRVAMARHLARTEAVERFLTVINAS